MSQSGLNEIIHSRNRCMKQGIKKDKKRKGSERWDRKEEGGVVEVKEGVGWRKWKGKGEQMAEKGL